MVASADYLLESDFLFLLLHKFGRDASDGLLGADQQVPQLLQEDASVLAVQETSQVHLHVLGVGILKQNTNNLLLHSLLK